jgi:hypothetical protein
VVRANLDTDDNAVFAAALRAADSRDKELPLSRRRADALTQICQYFLDHLDHGRETRDWATDLYNAIVLRDGGCRAGACDAPSSWCDVHHVAYWEHGGTTDMVNGVLLCRRHHRMVHKRGFQLKLLPDGTTELTTPTGEHLVNRPRGSPR